MSSAIVTIDLTKHPPNIPLGMLLAPSNTTTAIALTSSNHSSPTSSNIVLVSGWQHDTSTNNNNSYGASRRRQLGPIQRSGLVRLGDRLVRINGKDVTDWTFREVMDALKQLTINATSATTTSTNRRNRMRLKSLGFAKSGSVEWSRGAATTVATDNMGSTFLTGVIPFSSQHVIHDKRTYSFVSFIGRWRVAYESIASDIGDNERANSSQSMNEEQQQPRLDSDHSNNARLLSENSTSELEKQLFKEPVMMQAGEDAKERPSSIASPFSSLHQNDDEDNDRDLPSNNNNAETNNKPCVQYEIQCHIVFRDTSSFQTNNNQNNNNIHHSWSVWKRYSELQTLDEELRYDFGWLMNVASNNTTNENGTPTAATTSEEGIIFPSSHDIESWWYGIRNGGGYVTSLFGGVSSDIAPGGGAAEDNDGKEGETTASSGWGPSNLYSSFFRTPSNSSAAATTRTADTNNTTKSNCPIPYPFIEKRQRELTSYWTNLMQIEDIFEFSDIHSHKFGKVMAKFLEVDKVLIARSNISVGGTAVSVASSQFQQQQMYHHPFPAIHENEAEPSLGLSPLRDSGLSNLSPYREVSGLTIHDDDVSILTENTGAFGDVAAGAHQNSPIRCRPVVDVVPKHYTNGIDAVKTTKTPPDKPVASASASVASSASRRSRRRVVGGPKAKPAFQRQFMPP